MLGSGTSNWDQIIEILADPMLVGVLVKLTSTTCGYLTSEAYLEHALRLLEAIRKVRHIVFIHQTILTGVEEFTVEEEERRARLGPLLNDLGNDEALDFFIHHHLFGPPPKQVRLKILEQLRGFDLNIAPYRRNFELSAMASHFIAEGDKKLLFRIYIPTGRIWAAQADRLITLRRSSLRRSGRTDIAPTRAKSTSSTARERWTPTRFHAN